MEGQQVSNSDYNLALPYFDKEFYRKSYGIGLEEDSLRHYLDCGAALGYDPSDFFSSSYYLHEYPGVRNSNINPLVHYLRFGSAEGRMPMSIESMRRRMPGVGYNNSELNLKNWHLPCVLHEPDLPLDSQGMLEVMTNLSATKAPSSLLKRDSDDWLIVFSGQKENFFLVRKMMYFWGNILFIRDTSDKFYCKLNQIPHLCELDAYIDYVTGPRSGRTILLGQSYGGMAAIYQSSKISDCVTFAFSPQVFHPHKYPHGVYFENSIKKVMPDFSVPDVLEHLKCSKESPRYVISGLSESSHDSRYYWGDAVGAGLIASTGKAVSIIVNRSEHSTVRYLDSKKFFSILLRDFDVFKVSMDKGAKILASEGIYYNAGKN